MIHHFSHALEKHMFIVYIPKVGGRLLYIKYIASTYIEHTDIIQGFHERIHGQDLWACFEIPQDI